MIGLNNYLDLNAASSTYNSSFEGVESSESKTNQIASCLYSNIGKVENNEIQNVSPIKNAVFFSESMDFTKATQPNSIGKAFEFMSTRIRGKRLDGISKKCDWFIGSRAVRKNTEIPKTIFLSSYSPGNFSFFVDTILPTLKEDFVLIIANSSKTFPVGDKSLRYKKFMTEDNLKRYPTLMANKYLKCCFVENLDRVRKGLQPLPLGMLPYNEIIKPLPRVSFRNRLTKAMCIQRQRKGPQFKERSEVTKKSKTIWKEFVNYRGSCSRPEFLNYLKKHSFCICVHGNGIDPSPKAWEALAMGCIPIVRHSTLDQAYSRFPIAFVDSWDKKSITLKKLQKWRDELRPRFEDPKLRAEVIKMLSIDYWWDIILSKLDS